MPDISNIVENISNMRPEIIQHCLEILQHCCIATVLDIFAGVTHGSIEKETEALAFVGY